MHEDRTGNDHLTGLLDRSALENLDREFSAREHPWSLVIIDIDHFKLVNDIYGHLAGDDVLSHVGHTIRVNLKRNDHAVRYGGDEFLVLLPDTGGNSALDLAQRLLFELESREFPGGLKVSASMGIAQSRPGDRELKDVLAMADQALYRAKETGRGRFVLADNLLIRKEVEPDFTHMVGRREELQILRDRLDGACGGKFSFCTITGYRGMGKTRLISELESYCAFRGMEMIRFTVHPIREEYGFLAANAVKLALNALGDHEREKVVQNTGEVERSSVEHLGSFGFRIRERSIAPTADEAWVRSRKDFSAVLSEAAALKPLFLVLDDIHNAPEECVRYLGEVLTGIEEAPLFAVAASENFSTLLHLKPLLSRESSVSIHLEPLSRSDVRTMLFFALKSPDVPDSILEYMVRQSGGNTLFLRTLIKWCISSGAVSVGEGNMCGWDPPKEEEFPGELQTPLSNMLRNYSEEFRKVLKRAALAGMSFTLKLLSNLTGMGEFTLAEILDVFAENGLIKDNGESFQFTFGVMRSYLVSSISPSLRAILHEKTGAALEESYNPGDTGLTEKIAAHYCRSRNSLKALKYSGCAARQAFAMGNHARAIYWYQEYLGRISRKTHPDEYFRANLNLGTLLSITGRADEGEELLRKSLQLARKPVDVCGVHYRLGDNFRRKSDYDQAMEHFGKAIATGESSGDKSMVMLNNLIGSQLEFSFISRLQSRPEEASAKLARARDMMDNAPEGFEPSLEGLYYARLADLEAETGSTRKALEYYRKGLDIAISNNDVNGEALILNNMHSLFMLNGDYNSMLDTLKEVVKLNVTLDDQLGLAIAYYNLAESYSSINMLDLAKRYFDLYIELNSKIGNRLGMGYGQLGMGKLLTIEDAYQGAVNCYLNAAAIFQELGCTEMMHEAKLKLAETEILRENYTEAGELLNSFDESSGSREFCNRVTHWRGYLLVITGESVDRGIFMVESSIRNAEDLTPFDVVSMYGNLYRAYRTTDSSEQAVHSLANGMEILEDTLALIKTDSIRNSILSRKDIAEFLNTCREKGVACRV